MLEEAEDAYLLELAREAKAAQGGRPYSSRADVLADYAEDFGEEVK